MRWNVDFASAPLLVIWEVTRACELACRHCRASAENLRHPGELTTEEGFRLVDAVAGMGTPLMIFTGGDPLQRDDLEDLIRHAKGAGLRAGTIPATTSRLTRERMLSLRDAGVDQIALSVDGPDAKSHDDFRRVEGSFAKLLEGARWAREAGIPLQANTVFGSWNVHEFDRLAALVTELGIVFWEVFFLVQTGRGTELQGCTPEEAEALFGRLCALAETAPFTVKVTEGHPWRRVMAQRRPASAPTPSAMPSAAPASGGHPGGAGGRPRMGFSPKAVNSGNGFCFVDHIGNICPSGFLPIVCGNVRQNPLADVYRGHELFLRLRDLSLLQGRCGRCDFRETCGGGSRARAYALTGDVLAEDPLCIYQPPTPA